MLSDIQIEDLSQRMTIPLAGVYFKDELPTKLECNKTYIINLDDSTDDNGNFNSGTHWTLLQINKYPNDKIEPIYFDPYGVPPPENIKKIVKQNFKQNLPFTNKDIQSLMNNSCGFYTLAFSYWINVYDKRSKLLYEDVCSFLSMFDDLNTSIDWKKNEYILKHFFQSSDPKLRKEIDVIKPISSISSETGKGQPDMMKMKVDINYVK
jgi:hypothetical protein